MFNFWKKSFLTPQQKTQIEDTIAIAEKNTSGEIRVFIEKKCTHDNVLEQAKLQFKQLQMFKTKQRNGVLLYIAYESKKIAVYGDAGIYEKVDAMFWDDIILNLSKGLHTPDKHQYIQAAILNIGEKLKMFFPYDKINDTDELKNEVVIK